MINMCVSPKPGHTGEYLDSMLGAGCKFCNSMPCCAFHPMDYSCVTATMPIKASDGVLIIAPWLLINSVVPVLLMASENLLMTYVVSTLYGLW